MNPAIVPAEYRNWGIKMGTTIERIGHHWRHLTWCYAISTTGQTTEKAIAESPEAAYKATCERVDRIEEARK
jgi:hypothetical protein